MRRFIQTTFSALTIWMGLGSPSLYAHIVVPLTLETMYKQTDTIVSGVVKSQTTHWKNKKIYTVSVVQVQTQYKGRDKSHTLAVEQLGGTIGKIRMQAFGVKLLKPQARVLLFLTPYQTVRSVNKRTLPVHKIVGMAQGQLHFVKESNKDYLVQDLTGLVLPSTLSTHNHKTRRHPGTHSETIRVYQANSILHWLQSKR